MKTLKKTVITSLALFCWIIGYTQNNDSLKKAWSLKFDGFVKTDFWWDSRQVVDSREGIVLMYPKKAEMQHGKDINAQPSFNYSAITSRLRGKATGPDVWGAKTSAMIEGDFSGLSNSDVNGFRLRHAIITLKWPKAELMLGNFWHPMFVTDVIPDVYSLNTGVPFQPFIRNPQITFTKSFGKFNIITSLLSQRDYTSDGPKGRVSDYIRNSMIPNAHLQLQYKSEHHIAGLAGDYKELLPATVTAKGYKTNSKVASYSLMAYYKFTSEKFTAKFKTILGQNMTEHLLLGGYAVHDTIDRATGSLSYTPTNHLFAWVGFTYGKNIKPGLFAGYAKNLGTTESNTGTYYATAPDIEQMYRITPNCTFIANKFWFITELEYTVAAFGKGKPDQKGRWKAVEEVGNIRALIVVMYFF